MRQIIVLYRDCKHCLYLSPVHHIIEASMMWWLSIDGNENYENLVRGILAY